MVTRRYICLALWAVLAAGAAWAQGAEPPAVEPAVASKQANFIRVDGTPTVLLWARGLTDAAEVDAYAAVGFNTAYVLLTDSSSESLAASSSLASAAEARGLLVVAAITPAAVVDEQGKPLAPDPLSDAYARAVDSAVAAAAGAMTTHPRLIAWSIEAVRPEQVVWNDEGFRTYLQRWYPSLSALNASWGANFDDWGEITVSGVRDIDSTLPGGLGRASVDFAYYRESAYADVLSRWASALKRADPGRLLLVSSLPDYRSIISVPGDFDGLVLNTFPTVAEADWDTSNVHAVDIARRANQFAAVQGLLTQRGQDVTPARLAAWANLALLHGAAGLACSDWAAIRDSAEMRAVIQQTAQALQASAAFPAEPLARAAVLYEPIVGGAMRNGAGLYGYLDGVTPNEPTSLFAAARNGSKYGQIDVLALDSLSQVDLGQYGAIIAPAALYLPQDSQLVLYNYVLRGGALVADAGVGMYEADGTLISVPATLRDLFGLRYSELAAGVEPPEFSTLGSTGQTGSPGEPGSTGEGTTSIPLGTAASGAEINPSIQRFADLLEQFLARGDVRTYLGADFVAAGTPFLRVRATGQGFTVYAPAFLYENWDTSDPYFDEFHARVLSWGAEVEMTQPADVWPADAVALYSTYAIAVAAPGGQPAGVLVSGANNQMYLVPGGAMRLQNPDGGKQVELLFPGAPLAVAEPVPVFITPLEEGAVVTASLTEYGPQKIALVVHGTDAAVGVGRTGVTIRGGDATAMRIEVANGAFRIAPGAMYQVTTTEARLPHRSTQQVTMPNPETGNLTVTGTFASVQITIEPAPQ